MHVPPATIVTVELATVHTDGVADEKVRVNDDVALPLTENGVAPKVLFSRAPNVMV